MHYSDTIYGGHFQKHLFYQYQMQITLNLIDTFPCEDQMIRQLYL